MNVFICRRRKKKRTRRRFSIVRFRRQNVNVLRITRASGPTSNAQTFHNKQEKQEIFSFNTFFSMSHYDLTVPEHISPIYLSQSCINNAHIWPNRLSIINFSNRFNYFSQACGLTVHLLWPLRGLSLT